MPVDLDVLHVLATNERRGAETFGYELHQALVARGVRSGIRCVEPGPGDRSLPVPPLADRRFSLSGIRALRTRAAGARVVVAHGSSTLLACGVGLAGLGRPFVYLSIGDPRYWAGSRTRRLRVRWLIRRAATVAAIAPSARDALVSHYGLAPEQVAVIPNGRSGERFRPAGPDDRAAARKVLGLDTNRDVVAIIGALSPEKRVDVAIEAVGRLQDVILVVAGDGPQRRALVELAGRLAPGRVVFVGRTNGPESVLSAADVMALSSDSEGVPGVVIEAGLSALPVVATDVGWVRDVVVHGKTGLLVPPGRSDLFAGALREALGQRVDLGRAARARCLVQFEMGRVTDLWQKLIGELGNRTA